MGKDSRTALTVGVTGTRVMPQPLADSLRPRVAGVLALIRDLAGHDRKPRLVSPLAEGADRLVAEEALKLGYALLAPLPFPRADYELDFTDSVAAFRGLLAQTAEVIELDGSRGTDEAASYEAVGHHVVRNCRLLIAIWDGKTTGKRGGTAEITLFAARNGVPIYWIPADGLQPARWIDGEDRWHLRQSLPCEAADAMVADCLGTR